METHDAEVLKCFSARQVWGDGNCFHRCLHIYTVLNLLIRTSIGYLNSLWIRPNEFIKSST